MAKITKGEKRLIRRVDKIMGRLKTSEGETIKARILNKALEVEMVVGLVINEHFIENEKKSNEFNDLIIGKEFFTFEQKIRVLKKMDTSKYERIIFDSKTKNVILLSKNKKDLIKEIRYVQEIRNALAHNYPYFNKDEREVIVEYGFDREEKKVILNNKGEEEFQKRANEIVAVLIDWVIHNNIKH